MKPSVSRRGPFLLPRFLATLLIAGQLAWGLPARADDALRPSVEGTQAGLEQTLQAAGQEEDLGEMLKAQTLSLLNKVLSGPEITAVTADHLRRLQNLFQAASPEQKRLFLRDLVRIYGPSLERLARGRVREAAKLPPAAEDADPPIVVAGPAVNLNLNIGWKSSETSPATLEIDLAGTSLKADGSPANVMETLQQLGQAYRSIGVRSGGERPIGRIFFDLLRVAGIPATGWPAASPDIDFAPTMTAGALGLDLRFLPPEPRWEPSELEAYAQAVHRAIEGLGQANRRTALLWTSRVPANAPPGFLSDLFRAGRERGIFVVYDPKVTTLDDPAILQALLQAGPHLVAPNLEEFSALAGRPVARTPAEIVRAARELLAKSDLQMILISLAGEGALLVDQARVAYANVEPEIAVLGPGGAGDVGLANLLHLYTQAEKIRGSFSELTDEDFVALLRAYVAGGAAAVQMPGDETPTGELVGEMERRVHTKLFKNPSQEQLSRFGGFGQLRARADAPYRDQVWVPRLERFFYSHPAVPSADNAGSDLYLNFILSRPERFRGKEVLDPVTGSGVLAAALALAGAGRVVATDISPEAARLAEANLNGIPEIRGRVTVGVSDVYDNLPNITDIRQFDVVVANSPTGRWNPVPGQSRTHEASAGEGFEVPRKLLGGLSQWTKASGEGAYMTTRGVPEEDPPRRLTARYLGRLLAPGWAAEPTGYEAMGRSEKVPLMIQHVHRIKSAGMEETWPSVLVVRPVLRFPALAPDPAAEGLLTLPFSRDLYRATLDWLNTHQFQMPRSAQLFDHLLGSNHSKTPSGKMRMDRTQLVVPFQQVERQTQGSRLPIFELPPEVRPSVVDFLGIYLLTLQLPPERAQELPIPARWSLRRFHVTAHRARNQLPHLREDPRWGAFLDRIGQIPRSTRRILAGEPVIVVQADEISAEGRGAVEQMAGNLPADATDDLRTFLASYMDRRLRLERDRLQETEVPIPPGWDLGRVARVVERWRPALERIAASDEVLRLTLRQMDRLVGSQPEPSLSDTQRKTVRAYLRRLTHTSRGIQLPTPEQVAEERGDVSPTTAASHLREIRGQFQGRGRAEAYLPVASRREFSRMLEESVQAYNRDHRPEARITVSPGQLYQIYVVFQRLSGAERRRPVSWADLGRETGKISPQEARVRLEALDRLFRYLGIRLTETWHSSSPAVQLAEPPSPEPPPPPSAEEIVSRRLQEILQGEKLDSAADWPVLLDLAREQLVQEGLLGKTASLPETTVQALYQQIVNPGGASAGMEEKTGAVRRALVRIALGGAVTAGAWMLAREMIWQRPVVAPAPQRAEKPEAKTDVPVDVRSQLKAKIAHGPGLYLWELRSEVTDEELRRYLPGLLDYVKEHKIRKAYLGLPATDGGALAARGMDRFEKELARWEPLLRGLKAAGVQVWLNHHATWWAHPEEEWPWLSAGERGTLRPIPRDTDRFLKDPAYALRYDLEYAVPVHTRFHLKALRKIVGSAEVRGLFDGIYLHLEPYWTVGWTDSAGEKGTRRYLGQYLQFLEDAHGVTMAAKMPMMVNSWQGALKVPEGIHAAGPTSKPLQWNGRPLIEEVRERAEVVNVWIQGVDPNVSTQRLNALLAAQDAAFPLEVTLELFDEPGGERARENPEWPGQLWGIVGEVSQRWAARPFSITIRGDQPGRSAAPKLRTGKAEGRAPGAGMEETAAERIRGILERLEPGQPKGAVLLGPEALAGDPETGRPALLPLLLEERLLPQQRQAVRIFTRDPAEAKELRGRGFPAAESEEELAGLVSDLEEFEFYTTAEESLALLYGLPGAKPIFIEQEAFREMLGRLLVLLGYLPAAPEVLDALSEALKEYA